jgi:hypothetical protein
MSEYISVVGTLNYETVTSYAVKLMNGMAIFGCHGNPSELSINRVSGRGKYSQKRIRGVV